MEFGKCGNDLKNCSIIRSIIITDKRQRDTTIESLNGRPNGTRIVDAETVANKLNNYFVSIAQSLDHKIPESLGTFMDVRTTENRYHKRFPESWSSAQKPICWNIRLSRTDGL